MSSNKELIDGYSNDEILSIVKNYIENKIEEYALNIDIVDIKPYGSRRRGTNREDSDLDILFEYSGDEREDYVFNCLNEDRLEIDNIEIDINPITENESGTIEQNLQKAAKYDDKILNSLKEDLEEDLLEKAKKTFGTTLNYRLAGYLLPDGKLLDFSGGSRSRAYDHREISEIYDDIFDSSTEYMINFMRLGAIRLCPEVPAINIINEPTPEQYIKISSYYERLFDDYFEIEIFNEKGYTIASWSYETRVSYKAVILDIKEFFKSGRIPELLESKDTKSNSIHIIHNYNGFRIEEINSNNFRIIEPKINNIKFNSFSDAKKYVNSNLTHSEIKELSNKNIKEKSNDESWFNQEDRGQSRAINEDTRNTLINKSKNAGLYKNSSKGKNRFERKKYSKILNQVKAFNSIDMNELFKFDTLLIKIPVLGETNNYNVEIKVEGLIKEIAANIKNNRNQFEYRTVIQALTKVLNSENVYISCDCDDYKYNFKHNNIIAKVGVEDSSKDPGPGKNIANPNDSKGRGCKHILLVLNNLVWVHPLSSTIQNYIKYMAEHKKDLFLKYIFPKLYGILPDEASEKELVPEDTKLESEKDLIDLINEYAKNKGKFNKGSNVNPKSGEKVLDLDKIAKK